jgi:hypothetical protein
MKLEKKEFEDLKQGSMLVSEYVTRVKIHRRQPHSSSFLSVPSFVSARRSRRRFASPLPASLHYRTAP